MSSAPKWSRPHRRHASASFGALLMLLLLEGEASSLSTKTTTTASTPKGASSPSFF